MDNTSVISPTWIASCTIEVSVEDKAIGEEKTYFLNGRTGEGEKENVKTLYFNKELEAIIMIYTCDMDP